MITVADKILARAKRHGAGWVFSAKHMSDVGARAATDQALGRLVKDGSIRRLARGLYDLPRVHPILGLLSPNPDAVAAAAAEQVGHRLQISPARKRAGPRIHLHVRVQIPTRALEALERNGKSKEVTT